MKMLLEQTAQFFPDRKLAKYRYDFLTGITIAIRIDNVSAINSQSGFDRRNDLRFFNVAIHYRIGTQTAFLTVADVDRRGF